MILEEGGLEVVICMILSNLLVMMCFGNKYYTEGCWQHWQLGNGQIM